MDDLGAGLGWVGELWAGQEIPTVEISRKKSLVTERFEEGKRTGIGVEEVGGERGGENGRRGMRLPERRLRKGSREGRVRKSGEG